MARGDSRVSLVAEERSALGYGASLFHIVAVMSVSGTISIPHGHSQTERVLDCWTEPDGRAFGDQHLAFFPVRLVQAGSFQMFSASF